MKSPLETYEKALQDCRDYYPTYSNARFDYRKRRIGDIEFCAIDSRHKELQRLADKAKRRL